MNAKEQRHKKHALEFRVYLVEYYKEWIYRQFIYIYYNNTHNGAHMYIIFVLYTYTVERLYNILCMCILCSASTKGRFVNLNGILKINIRTMRDRPRACI